MRLLALATLVGFVTNALAVSVPLFETDVVASSSSDSAELGPGNSTDANSLDALAGLRKFPRPFISNFPCTHLIT